MSRWSNKYSRGVIGVPSVLLIAGWGALWLVWPADIVSSTVKRTVSGTRIHYVDVDKDPYGDPRERFGPESILPQNGHEESSLLLSHHRARNPDYKAGNVEAIGGVPVQPHVAQLLYIGKNYSLGWHDDAVFATGGHRVRQVVFTPSGDLQACEFSVPADVLAGLKGDGEWEVAVRIDVGDGGKPEHVFLESSCGDKSIDARVIRAMYRGRSMKEHGRCCGSAKVSLLARWSAEGV